LNSYEFSIAKIVDPELVEFRNSSEGDGVVDEECDGRCLPCCLAAILEAAAQ
jgi:hypothetical protein